MEFGSITITSSKGQSSLTDFLQYEESTLTSFECEVQQEIKYFFNESPTIRLQSSGTTGTPKTFEAPKQHLIYSAKRTIKFFGLNEQSKILLNLPIEFIAGKMQLIRALVCSGELLISTPKSAPDIASFKTIDFAAFTPHQVSYLLKEKVQMKHMKNIKNVIIGGAPVSTELENALLQHEIKAFETFGSTETYTHFALRKFGQNAFTVLEGIKLEVDSNQCLLIKGEYFLTPLITTNDVVELLSENTFKWVGRRDNVINSGGVKIHPESLEQDLKLPVSFILSAVPDSVLGEKLVLVIQGQWKPKPDLFKNIAPLLRPKVYVNIPKLPRTSSNKVKRSELKRLIANMEPSLIV